MTSPEQLVARYGSPLYVYDLPTLRHNAADLKAALPDRSDLLYSLKANPHARLVRELAASGCGAEVSSASELNTAFGAGVAPGDIVYTGPGKTAVEIAGAVEGGARWFSVDSAAQFAAVRAVADATGTDLRVLIRVNPERSVAGSGLVMTGVASQFGLDASAVEAEASAFVGTGRCRVVGLHFYLGSGLPDVPALLEQFSASVSVALRLHSTLGFDWEVLDLGGGFGRAYARTDERPDLTGLREGLEDILAAVPREVRVVFESGRFLAASAGCLIATVVDVKRSKGRWFVILDSGINHLGGMSALGRLPRIRPELLGIGPTGATGQVSVVGPLCTPLDWWTRAGETCPEPGALVRVPNTGAYGLTASLLAFLGRDCPAEIVVDEGAVVDASMLHYARRPLDAGESHVPGHSERP